MSTSTRYARVPACLLGVLAPKGECVGVRIVSEGVTSYVVAPNRAPNARAVLPKHVVHLEVSA